MMVDIDEIIFRLCHADERTVGKLINEITDLYREGADLRTLVPLLAHSDPKFVSIGAWIASEVVDGCRGREIFDELSILLDHPDPAIRFGAVEGVALLIRPEDRVVIHRLFLLAADPNPGVRQHALSYLCRIPDAVVGSLRGTSVWPIARLLLADVNKDEIRSAVRSGDLFAQRMAVAAAARNFGHDEAFIEEVFPYFDEEISAAFDTLPKNRGS